MKRLALAGLFALALLAAPTATADPPCAAFNVCQYQPSYNGPLQPTWNTPGTYGGWTSNQVLCDPVTYQCRQVVAGN